MIKIYMQKKIIKKQENANLNFETKNDRKNLKTLFDVVFCADFEYVGIFS